MNIIDRFWKWLLPEPPKAKRRKLHRPPQVAMPRIYTGGNARPFGLPAADEDHDTREMRRRRAPPDIERI